MFERFTDRARRIVVLAQEEARLLNHDWIGTEHLLLGLVHEGENIAAEVLRHCEIELEVTRTEVEKLVGKGERPPRGHRPFTPRLKKVLELSLREALRLGHSYIGPEHLFLGFLCEGEGKGCLVMQSLGADLPSVRQEVITILRTRYGLTPPETEGAVPIGTPLRTRADVERDIQRHVAAIKTLRAELEVFGD
jgi:ATP-dependent Clp protease ATP-binding subunit ClpC